MNMKRYVLKEIKYELVPNGIILSQFSSSPLIGKFRKKYSTLKTEEKNYFISWKNSSKLKI